MEKTLAALQEMHGDYEVVAVQFATSYIHGWQGPIACANMLDAQLAHAIENAVSVNIEDIFGVQE